MSQTTAFRQTRKITQTRLPEIKQAVDAAFGISDRSAAEVAASINNDYGTFYSPRQITAIWLSGSPYETV